MGTGRRGVSSSHCKHWLGPGAGWPLTSPHSQPLWAHPSRHSLLKTWIGRQLLWKLRLIGWMGLGLFLVC